MWVKAFPVAIAMAAMAFAVPLQAQTADDYADEWSEARRGDRDWKQRATEELTTGLTERVMGRPPTGPMNEAVNLIQPAIGELWRRTRDPCLAAALNQADSQVNATGRQTVMAGAFDMLTSALGGAASGNDIRRFLGQRLFNQIKDKLQGQALDRFKQEMRDAMKRGLPDYWSDSNNSAACNVEYRGVWDRATERYEFIIVGDCNCNRMPCGPHLAGASVLLRRWTVEGWGTIEPIIEQGAQGEKTIRWAVSRPRDIKVTAECCGQGDQRTYRSDPRNDPGNSWVTEDRPAQTVPSTPLTPPRPQTGTTPPTAAPPAPTAPPRQPIEIPEVPDRPMTEAELEQLGERIQRAQQQAEDLHRRASTYLDQLQDRQPPPTEAEIRDAEAAVEEAGEAVRRARAALDKVMEKFNQLGQPGEDQSSIVPPERLDRTSAQLLAIHNRERAQVGSQPLQWDSVLATSATAYARHLATGAPYAHAGRTGRREQRENLNLAFHGSRPEQLIGNWLAEKRNFVPGIFPNVSRTGNWRDAGHYSQMIWPTTRRVGCGVARGPQWDHVVCRYSPPGNQDGGRVP